MPGPLVITNNPGIIGQSQSTVFHLSKYPISDGTIQHMIESGQLTKPDALMQLAYIEEVLREDNQSVGADDLKTGVELFKSGEPGVIIQNMMAIIKPELLEKAYAKYRTDVMPLAKWQSSKAVMAQAKSVLAKNLPESVGVRKENVLIKTYGEPGSIFRSVISVLQKRGLIPITKTVDFGNGYLAKVGIRKVLITKPDGKRFKFSKQVWNELEKTGNVNVDAIRAVEKELSLRDAAFVYRSNRGLNEVNRLLGQAECDDISKMVNSVLSKNPGKIVKIRIVGDGDGYLARGIKNKFLDRVDVQQISLTPAKQTNAFAYSKQVVADVEAIPAMPWSDADIIIDFNGAALWSENKFDVIAKEINSLAVGGEGVFITNDALLAELVTKMPQSRMSKITMPRLNNPNIQESVLVYHIQAENNEFIIKTSVKELGIHRPIYLRVFKKVEGSVTGAELYELLTR